MSELNEILNYEATVSKFVSNKTYSGHKVVKTIIETKIYEPVKCEELTYRFNVGFLDSFYSNYEYKKFDKGISKEIETFCQNRIDKEQRVYFFNEVIKLNGDVLPLFYGVLYLGDFSHIDDYNSKNLKSFKDRINDCIKDYVFEQKLLPSFSSGMFHLLHYLGDEINKFLFFNEKRDECDDVENALPYYANNILEFEKKYSENEPEPALVNYMKAVVKSFCNHVIENKFLRRCDKCGCFFMYKNNKKYCSESCNKGMANKKNYQRRKSKTKKYTEL